MNSYGAVLSSWLHPNVGPQVIYWMMTQYTNKLEICLKKDEYDTLEWQTHTDLIIKKKPHY